MKEVILVFGKKCIESELALLLIKSLQEENFPAIFKTIEFSFDQSIVKAMNIFITPTIIIDNQIKFVGVPEKDLLISELI